jgi:DNA-directed RNA polymerase II subunit RPB1
MTSNYMNKDEIANITGIDFSIFSNKLIRDISAVKNDLYGITLPESYDNFEPKKGGLVDARLGPPDTHSECSTCGLNYIECPGHFGHAELAEYVFHDGFLDYLKNILECICVRCSTLLINKTDEEIRDLVVNKNSKKRFNIIRNLTKNVSYCTRPGYGCGAPVPKIRKEKKKSTATIKMFAEFDSSLLKTEGVDTEKKITLQNLTPDICYDILKNISDTDCKIMGIDPAINRPENVIIKMFPIPPTAIRPSVRADFLGSATAEDSLTHIISYILKHSNKLRKQHEKDLTAGIRPKLQTEYKHLLQYHVAIFFDNDSASLPASEQKSGGKKLKSISERLKAKGGRIRNNLMGNLNY